MVLTVAVRTGSGWSRRSVLAAGVAGAAGLLTGCSWLRPDPPPPPPPDPLTPLVATATALVLAYDRTIAAHPDLSSRLSPVRDAHAAHAEALAELIRQPPAGTGAAWVSPAPATVPPEPDQALAALRDAEQAAYGQAAEACLAAPAARAPTIGSVCAAIATHLEVLR